MTGQDSTGVCVCVRACVCVCVCRGESTSWSPMVSADLGLLANVTGASSLSICSDLVSPE